MPVKRFDSNVKSIYHRGVEVESIMHCNKEYYNATGLSASVKAAIYADGYSDSIAAEIWAGVKVYAKTHRQIVSYINSDPDMYCSLPISVSAAALAARKVRGMHTDGSAYAKTNIIPNNSTVVKTIVKRTATGSFKYIFGSAGSAGKSSYYFLGANGNAWYCEISGSNKNFGTATQNVRYKIEFSVTTAKIDGVEYSTGNPGSLGANTATISIGRCTNANGSIYDNPWTGSIDNYFSIEKDGSVVAFYVPYKQAGVMEWLDLETQTLATRIGTFTEVKENP